MALPENPKHWRLALVGYGEVGRILAEDLRRQGMLVSACDLKVGAGDTALARHAGDFRVPLFADHATTMEGADLVISAVTASQTVVAAQACSFAIQKGAFFLDLNSASPAAKIVAADMIEAVGGRYVEGAVMTSVPPYRSRVPLLLGGSHAAALAPALKVLGFAPRVGDERLGVVSATKMCRSVMIKGLEAMVIESFTAARAYGVEDAVIASLAETFPGIDWEKQGSYFFQRVIEHGRRRAEEMAEVAQTVLDTGLVPLSATASAERATWMADCADAGIFGSRGGAGFAHSPDWRTEADRIIAAAKTKDTPADDI
ncbi:MAG: NAD(P)-dependent oxidoreductase [Rhodocyclales bacterium]|nr:NAD(P)-dependent oxidoreductase [Rhodocyclales bacterium]